MIELLSIHIPKTGGTSFYHVLQMVYGDAVTVSFKRRDYQAIMARHGSLEQGLPPGIRAVHGHLYYREVAAIHQASGAHLICWLRHPVERLASNYRFFRHRLLHPELNPEVFEQNKHRIHESLLEYAALEENRNRMSRFLDGIGLEQLFFIGFLEDFENDLQRLARQMGWPPFSPPHFNKGALKAPPALDENIYSLLAGLNREDMELYEKALSLKGSS